jgi:hypothetical protein
MAEQQKTREASSAAMRLGVVGTGNLSVADFVPTNSLVVPLLSDLYELTMAYAYWKVPGSLSPLFRIQEFLMFSSLFSSFFAHKAGKHEEPAVFDLFFRKNPFHGEVTIFAGLEEVVCDSLILDIRYYICAVCIVRPPDFSSFFVVWLWWCS